MARAPGRPRPRSAGAAEGRSPALGALRGSARAGADSHALQALTGAVVQQADPRQVAEQRGVELLLEDLAEQHRLAAGLTLALQPADVFHLGFAEAHVAIDLRREGKPSRLS